MNTLKPTKLYTSKGYIFWYVSYISIQKKLGVYIKDYRQEKQKATILV